MKRVLLLACVALGIISFFVWRWAAQPVVGKPTEQVTQVQAKTTKGPTDINTAYFQTKLEGSLAIRSNQEGQTAQLLQQIVALNEQNANSDQLAITIGLLPAGGIEELSAVKFRTSKAQDYTRVSVAGMPVDAVVFRSTGSQYEFSVFWPKGTMYAAIVSSGTKTRQQDITTQMMTTINSWQWR